MKRSIEYIFFYLKGSIDPYAYSDDKDIIKEFKKTRNMDKFIFKKILMNNDELHILSEINPGSLLMNYDFKVGDLIIRVPITMNEKLNIEAYGNRIVTLDIYMCAGIPIELFKKEIQKDLKLIEYDDAFNFDSDNKEYHIFTPDLFIIFCKYYGDLMNFTTERGK